MMGRNICFTFWKLIQSAALRFSPKYAVFLAILLASTSTFAAAGETTVEVRFEPDSIFIGDRTKLVIEVEQDAAEDIAFPEFQWTATIPPTKEGEEPESIEVLEQVDEPRTDTLNREGRRIKLRREYLLTSFEAGEYNLGKVGVLRQGKNSVDTLFSLDSLRLKVGTFKIDSTSHAIYDLKPVRDLPFKFDEISGYVLWSILALIALALIALLVIRILAHFGHNVLGIFKPAPPQPAHLVAFEALDALRAERPWQSGDYKLYYSRLTDILRVYLSNRYSLSAVSMTTPEIVAAVRELQIPSRCEMDLLMLLKDADMVKFAKAEIDALKNEEYLGAAHNFVEQTREIEEEEEGIKQEKE